MVAKKRKLYGVCVYVVHMNLYIYLHVTSKEIERQRRTIASTSE